MDPKGSPLVFSKHVTESFQSEEPKARQYDDATLQSIDPFSELSQLMFDNDYNTFVSILKSQPEIINMKDYAGNSLLMLSAFWGKPKFCKYVLEMGCDPNIQNISKMNALDISLQWGHPEIAQNIVEVNGSTGIFTRIKGLEDTIEMLRQKIIGLENDKEHLESDLRDKISENGQLRNMIEGLEQDLEHMTSEKNKFETRSIEYAKIIESLEDKLRKEQERNKQLMGFNKKLRNHNYKLKDEAKSLNKSLQGELTKNSELRVTIITLNAWLKKLKQSAHYLNLQAMLHQEKEKEALLLKEKAKREMRLAMEKSKRLENIDKRCDLLEKKLARKDTFIAMDAVNKLVPPSIITDAMKGLQSLSKQRLPHPRAVSEKVRASANKTRPHSALPRTRSLPSKERKMGNIIAGDRKRVHLDYKRPVFSRAMGGATVPFDMLLVSPSGTGMSMVKVTDVVRDDDGNAEQMTIEYRTDAWRIGEPKSRMDYSEAKVINDFLEVDEILGSVVVRRQIQPKDVKAPSFPTVIKKK
eukprot:g10576.t1